MELAPRHCGCAAVDTFESKQKLNAMTDDELEDLATRIRKIQERRRAYL
jgi:hypothetical protein